MLTDFQNAFTDRFTGKYATKSSLIIPPHLKHVATLLCQTSISKNWRKSEACIVINDKSQVSIATCLRCGKLFSNHFTTDLLLSFLVKEFLKFVNIWRSYRQEGCFTRSVRVGTVLHKGEEFGIEFRTI